MENSTENGCMPKKAYAPEFDNFTCEDFICPTGLYCWVEGCVYCDEDPQNVDFNCFGTYGRPCIACYTCLSPIGIAFDLITLPFRTLYCSGYCTHKLCKKICKCKCCTKTTEG